MDATAAPAGPGDVQPFIPAERSLPEITVKAVALGVLLAVVLGAANMYVGLRVGLTVSASIPAAVMSMGILRLFRNSNILENNIVQTIAASGQSVAAGLIFTIPALLIVTNADGAPLWVEVHVVETMLVALAGGILGVLFTVPLRRAFVVETRLAYPEGVACAEVLKAGEQGGQGSRILFGGLVLGAAFGFLQLGMRLWRETLDGAARLGSAVFGAGMNLAPILVAVGYIVGLRVGSLLLAGGAFGWFVVIPLLMAVGSLGGFAAVFAALGGAIGWRVLERRGTAASLGGAAVGAVVLGGLAVLALPMLGTLAPAEPYTAAAGDPLGYAAGIWSRKIRLIGGGAMIVGGLWTLWKVRSSLARAFQGTRELRAGGAVERVRTERDLPLGAVGVAILVLAVPIAGLFYFFTGDVVQTLAATVLMGIAGFFFSAVAGYMAGLVGSSNNPISGVTILTLVSASLLLLALGATGAPGIFAALGVGAVICVAGAIAGDTLQDLKTGQLVGSTPWKQQVAQAVGAVAFGLVAAFVLQLLVRAYGIGGATGLVAPQAFLMSRILTGLFGGSLDWSLILMGMVFAVALVVLRQPVMAVAIGLYLPLAATTPIFLGGVIAWLVSRRAETAIKRIPPEAARDRRERFDRHGVLFASGLIAGEAIMGIVVAGLILAEPVDLATGLTMRVVTGRVAPLVLGVLVAAASIVFLRGWWRWVVGGAFAALGGAWTASLLASGAEYGFLGGAAWPGLLVLAYIALLVAYVPLRELRAEPGTSGATPPPAGE